MLELLSESARFLHVVFGATGLVAFWFPVFAKKGGRLHKRAGTVFKWCAYIVLGAAAVALTIRVTALSFRGITPLSDPGPYGFIIFLGYLVIVTFVVLHHGVTVLENKDNHDLMKTATNSALAWIAIGASTAVVAYALLVSPETKILLLALSPIGFLSGRGILRFINAESASPRTWFYEHLGAMIGAGIAFHTAFFVFGSTRLFDIGLTGWVAAIPWLAPSAIGIPATVILTHHYRRKFGEFA